MTDERDPALARRILEESRTVAVLGALPPRHAGRAGFYVPDYLAHQGYRIVPVNPRAVGETWWGQRVVATLADIPPEIHVDLVDVFRRPEHLPAHVPELLAMDPAPRFVWFQLGIRNDPVAERLREAGIEVVQDRCTLADHRRWGLPRVGSPPS